MYVWDHIPNIPYTHAAIIPYLVNVSPCGTRGQRYVDLVHNPVKEGAIESLSQRVPSSHSLWGVRYVVRGGKQDT